MKSKYKVQYRETLLVIVLGFSVLYLVFDRNWMLYTALGLGITGMLSAPLNRWIHVAWFFIGEKIGFVVSKVLLGTIFFVVLIPMSMLAKLFRKDIMNLKSSSGSAYHQRDHLYEPADLDNMW